MDYAIITLLCGICGLIGVWAGTVLCKKATLKKISELKIEILRLKGIKAVGKVTLTEEGKKKIKEALKDIKEGRIEKV